MQADCRQFQLACEGAAVERFDVYEFVDELVRTGLDLVVGQRVKHERVVGIRAVADTNQRLFSGHHEKLAFSSITALDRANFNCSTAGSERTQRNLVGIKSQPERPSDIAPMPRRSSPAEDPSGAPLPWREFPGSAVQSPCPT